MSNGRDVREVACDRRTAIRTIAGIALAVSRASDLNATPQTKDAHVPTRSRIVYVGCRTTRERNARGDGITVYRAPDDGAAWEVIQRLDGLVNPSFLAFDHARRTLYTVHGDGSDVSSFRVDAREGRLTFINRVGCRGKNPVHLVVAPSGRHLVVANHLTVGPHVSSLAVLAIGADGELGEVVDHHPLTGRIGPHRTEQPFAKPHQVVFDPAGRFLAVPDKGLDLVSTFRLDEAGRLHPSGAPPAAAREGAGPRHLAFHPTLPFVFVLNELSSTVMACAYEPDTGAITPHQEISALPDTFVGFSRASEIEIARDGRFVYASNRGHESIAAFAVDAATGRLAPVGWTDAAGRTPRFFTLDPSADRVLVANEDSDGVVSFARDPDSGRLLDPSPVARTGSPTCLLVGAG